MNRYNELKMRVLSLFAATDGEWIGPYEAAEKPKTADKVIESLRRKGWLERASWGKYRVIPPEEGPDAQHALAPIEVWGVAGIGRRWPSRYYGAINPIIRTC